MSDPLTVWQPRADAAADAERRAQRKQADTREAPGVLDTITAAFRAMRADTTGANEGYQVDAYRPIINALIELQPGAQFTRYVNPSTGTVSPQSVWRDVVAMRAKGHFPDLPATWEEFEQQWRAQKRTEIEGFEDVSSRGNPAAAFVGGLGGAMTDPLNLYSLPLGGFGATLGRRMLYEGLVNAGIETSQQPTIQRQREGLGRRDLTLDEAAANIGFGFAGGAALRGAIDLAPGAARATNEKLVQPLRRALDPDASDREIARAFEQMVPQHLRTPEQEAALFIINRAAHIEDANPFVRTIDGMDAHLAKVKAALDALEEGRIATPAEIAVAGTSVAPRPSMESVPDIAVRAGQRGVDFASVKAAIRGPESGGNDAATNRAGSSASGRYQFIEETFIGLYAREYGVPRAAAQQAWRSNRFDVNVQERLMDRFLADNTAALERAGIPVDTGNLYLAHFAGVGKAIELIRAPRDAPVAGYFSAKAIAQNRPYLGGGKTVGEAIDIIRAKVGDPAQVTPHPITPDLDTPPLDDARLGAERPTVMLNDRPIGTATFRASEIDVDADLMQFKSGGDEFGVTDRLRGVEEWDGYQAGYVTVWEAVDGRRLIADGHQRLGLAKRIGAQSGEDIRLNAFVMREADGITAADARRITALRNVAEGSGSKVDAAKVFRDLEPEMIEQAMRRMAKGQEFIRDASGLSRLEGRAFGAVVNEVIPENYGAAIGQLVDDPDLHMGMVEILNDTQPANRRQAEAIIRQALDAGFVRETQDSLFGSESLMTGLFAHRARLLDRALSELKRLKGAFGVAVRNADALDAAGNKIDVKGSAAEIEANALALALVNRLALRKGNAVNELLTRAAERIAAGEKPAIVLRDFIAEIRKLDLDDIARAADGIDGRGAGDGADTGRAAIADEIGDDGPGLFGEPELTPRAIDEARMDRPRSDHSDLPPDPDPRFAEPDSAGIKATADSVWHDIKAGEQPLADQVRAALADYGFQARGDELSMRIEGFAEEGTVSSGARVVTLRLDQQGRYLERLDGFGKVERDVDLRQFDDPQAAIEAVLGRSLPEQGGAAPTITTRADGQADSSMPRQPTLDRLTPEAGADDMFAAMRDLPDTDISQEMLAAARSRLWGEAEAEGRLDDVIARFDEARDRWDAQFEQSRAAEGEARMAQMREEQAAFADAIAERVNAGLDILRLPNPVRKQIAEYGPGTVRARNGQLEVVQGRNWVGVPGTELPAIARSMGIRIDDAAPTAAPRVLTTGERAGDFIEFYGDEARALADALDIAVASRGGREMAGVPIHSYEQYRVQAAERGVTMPKLGDDMRPDAAPTITTRADGQADFAAPTGEQTRIALERQTEGGIRPKGEQRAPGEDGGLFDTRDTTGNVFDVAADQPKFDLGDGKGARTASDIRAEIDQDISGLKAMRDCL
jgi:hypothetical protein